MNKKSLALILSKLKTFEKPKVQLEQYQTDSEIASQIVWHIFLLGNIEGKVIADLGCGNGIFGFASLILGAKKVYFVDKDKDSIIIAKENKKFLEKELGINLSCTFNNEDITEFNKKVDIVLQNPPFGTKEKHSDKMFLQKAFSVSERVYSIHKIESSSFLTQFSKDSGFNSKLIMAFDFPLPKTLSFHKKKSKRIRVGLWGFEKT